MAQPPPPPKSRNREEAMADLRTIIRSLSVLKNIKPGLQPGYEKLTTTITDLQQVLEIINSKVLSERDYREVSEDVLHGAWLHNFLVDVSGFACSWEMELRIALTEAEFREKDSLKKAVDKRAKFLLARQCYEVSRDVSSAAMAIVGVGLGADEASKTPIEDAHEAELVHYDLTLTKLLLHRSHLSPMAIVTNEEWQQAESCLKSLEVYLRETKIRALRIRITAFDVLIDLLMKSFDRLDREGLRKKVDAKYPEACWGLVDKIGSGINYLMQVNEKNPETSPTTHSIFFLKSAPPARLNFTTSRDEWRERELSKSRDKLEKLVLNKDDPIRADDEHTWNAVYRELETLESVLTDNDISKTNVRNVKLDSVVSAINAKTEILLSGVDQVKIEEDYVLMLISLELGMRVSTVLDTLHG